MNRLEESNTEQRAIEDTRTQLLSRKPLIASARMDDLRAPISDLQNAVRALQELKDRDSQNKDASLTAETPTVIAFVNRVNALEDMFMASLENLERQFARIGPSDLGKARAAIERGLRSSRIERLEFSDMLRQVLPQTYTLYQKLPRKRLRDSYGEEASVVSVKIADISTDIDKAFSEVSNLDMKTLEDLFKKFLQKLQEFVDQITRIFDSEIDQRRKSLTEQEKRVQDLNRQLAVMETEQQAAQAKQGQINDKLVSAVFYMIAAIVLLFALLRVFPEKLASAIVTERTMIELLSMGFLLLTVIILGTARLLGNEALSALLGTIAGYIFGRKEAERQVSGAVPSQQPSTGGTYTGGTPPVAAGTGAAPAPSPP